MKYDLPYFSHYSATHSEPRIQALLSEYGFEGYGRYWILCEKIASSQNAILDISSRIIKLTIMRTLELSAEELDGFIEFLSAPDIKLVKFENGFITSDQIRENYQRVSKKRERDRVNYNSSNDPIAENPIPIAENTQSKVNKSKVNKSSSSKEQTTTTTFSNFCINKQKAQELCAGLDPSWLEGINTYPEFIAEAVEKNYPDKPQDQKARLFITLFAAEDRKAMFPEWRQEQEATAAKQEAQRQKAAAEQEHNQKLEALKADSLFCEKCGGYIEPQNANRGTCPHCQSYFLLNEDDALWEFCGPISLKDEFKKIQRKAYEEKSA